MFEKPTPFIKHPNNPEREKPDEESLDLEYNREFLSSVKRILSEAGINVSIAFETLLKKDTLYCKAYIGLSMELRRYMDYSGPDVIRRAYLDEDLFDMVNKPVYSTKGFFPNDDYFKELGDKITKAYREKVNFQILLDYLKDPELDQAKKNILILLLQIMDPDSIGREDGEIEVPELSYFPTELGACSNTETHLLAYISGEHINPKIGHLNVVTNEHSEAIMLEKVGLGESNSCVTLVPIRLGGKLIPAGSILVSSPSELRSSMYSNRRINYGRNKNGPFDHVVSVDKYKGFKFVRFNLISLPEDIRARAGGDYYRKQWRAKGYINYDWVTPEFIAQHAKFCIKKYPFIRKFLPF